MRSSIFPRHGTIVAGLALTTVALCGANDPNAEAPELEITPGEPNVIGPLDVEIVERVVHHHLDDLQRCHSGAEEIEGDVTLRWFITPGGVEDVEVTESTLDNEDIGRCLVERVDGWTFPGPCNNIRFEVTYPFEIRPLGEEDSSSDEDSAAE